VTIVVAHDYLTQRGGAERVAAHLMQGLQAERMVTSVYNPATAFSAFAGHRIQTSALQRVPAFRTDPRLAFAFLAPAWSAFPPVRADVLLCSSSGWSHGLATARGTRKVVYCHNPPRWLWQPDDYSRGLGLAGRMSLGALSPTLKKWDVTKARTADQYIANSRVVQTRIRQTYGIEAPVVAPPVGLLADGETTAVEGLPSGFVLTIARGRGYKQVDAVIDAVRADPARHLVVVGSGLPAGTRPAPNVTVLGRVPDAQLRWLYREASALVTASREDFGLTPIEANQFGTPAVAVRAGGFLETIREGHNGVFFDDLEPASILAAMDRAERLNPSDVRAAAAEHQPDHFLRALSRYL